MQSLDVKIEEVFSQAGIIALQESFAISLEMRFTLYGHELSKTSASNESVSAWTIKWDRFSFLGKESLEKLEKSLTSRKAFGIHLLERGIVRQGLPFVRKTA